MTDKFFVISNSYLLMNFGCYRRILLIVKSRSFVVLVYFSGNGWSTNVIENSIDFKGIVHATLSFA